MFETNPRSLKDLLKQIDDGKLQLPDFQRDWVWDDEGIRSLLASIAAGFPVGALLSLTTGGSVKFKPRPLAHAPTENKSPEELLLDGQQRMTSCYQALMSDQPVKTKNSRNKEIELYYFIDMLKVIEEDARFDHCIVATPNDKIKKKKFGKEVELDLSDDVKQFDEHMFPLNQVLDSKKWFLRYQQHHGESCFETVENFDKKIVDRINAYQIPVIKLSKENSREAVCTVFEKVNIGGKKLDAFELLTAIFAADDFDLRQDMRGTVKEDGRLSRIRGKDPNGIYQKLSERDVLQIAALVQTYKNREEAKKKGVVKLPQVKMKEETLLELQCDFYMDNADLIEKGFIKARKFIGELNIFKARDLPSLALAKSLAAIYTVKKKKKFTATQKAKLKRWFWCISIGGSYGASTDNKVARDLVQIIPWIYDDTQPEPDSISETNIHILNLEKLRSRQTSGYKAMNAALTSVGCKDFRTGDKASTLYRSGEPIDIHHIFPRNWCKKNDIDSLRYDNIVNKTPLHAETNRIIKDAAPSEYLKKLRKELKEHGHEKKLISKIMKSHLIDRKTMKSDDFDDFYFKRREALAVLIENLTGRTVSREGLNDEDQIDDFVHEAAE